MSIPADRLRRASAGTPNPQAARVMQAARREPAPVVQPERVDWALPEYFTQPRVVIVGVLFCVYLIFGPPMREVYWSSEPKVDEQLLAEDCLHITATPGAAQVAPWPQDDVMTNRDERVLSRFTAHYAIQECPVDGCAGGDLANYVANLSGYLGTRMRAYDAAYGESGKAGIKAANAFYWNNKDLGIIDHANRMLKAGKFSRRDMALERFRYLELLIAHSRDKVPMCFVDPARANTPGTARHQTGKGFGTFSVNSRG